ncbi:putative bifunctional diguanylate cyclase/phosphodiesterase [Salinimonas chungwhensis]|uniref:putative bifunctional diguanylate cyclase/phosphodiesterase n=1 Tax=Salinimonas chungwhensis TaxID=265425 RepID=UPI00037EA2FA|nr:bifunctional diguanylate cyclase/phosphodiesterase [Salinimonas chungwhensis]
MQVKLSFLTKVMLLVLLMMASITATISSLLIKQSNMAIETQHQATQQLNMRRYQLLSTLLDDRILLWAETFARLKGGRPATLDDLTASIEGARASLDVSLQIDNIWLFSANGELLHGEAEAMPGFVSTMREKAYTELRPQTITSCEHLCRRYVATPVMVQGDDPAVLIFSSGTQAILALLSRFADVERIAIARGDEKAASMEVISRLSPTNKARVTDILQQLPDDTTIESLIAQGRRIDFDNRLMLVSLLPVLDGRLPDSYILFTRDITQQVMSARNYQDWVVGSALVTLAAFALLLYLILNHSRTKLIALSQRLPLLAEHRYDEFRRDAANSRNFRSTRLPDELDVLESAATNLAAELERIDIKMNETTAKLENMAMFDVLTGLPNRNMLMFQMEKEVSQRARTGNSMAILFLDMDDFKRINDIHGHDVGDKLIKAAAERLATPLRESDVAARFGGDEFVILLSGTENKAQLEVVANKLLRAFEAPIQFDAHQFYISLSIGIAFSENSDLSAVDLLRHADIAMYEAKAQHGSAYCIFDKTMHQKIMRRVELENDARIGLKQGHFSLALQPQVELPSRKLVGMEALIRWNHPEKGFISPAEFIPLLENTSLMMTIDYWVISQSISRLAQLHARGYTDVKVAINVSAAQFLDISLPSYLQQQINYYGVSPAHIELELTETALVADMNRATATLEAIRAMGCLIAIDDFGTGYSSLGYLKALPADFIKIDRSFVSGMEKSAHDRSIVASTISMVKGMGLTVIAEGIETEEQFDMLTGFGCHQGQGYLFSPPIPEASLWDQLNKNLTQGVWKRDAS